jgi:4-amino-4-deoxy-L-arabinose transferase-like glycosyltransferase
LPDALRYAWRVRSQPGVQFCLAWGLPTWLLFELMPTKLPHCVLPALPALALLAAGAVHGGLPTTRSAARSGAALFALVGVGLVAATIVALARYGHATRGVAIAGAVVLCVAILWTALTGWRQRTAPVAGLLVCGLLANLWMYSSVAPRLDRIWIVARAAIIIRSIGDPARCPVVVAGYRETSVVFLLGTATPKSIRRLQPGTSRRPMKTGRRPSSSASSCGS